MGVRQKCPLSSDPPFPLSPLGEKHRDLNNSLTDRTLKMYMYFFRMAEEENLKVAVRVRPFNSREKGKEILFKSSAFKG